MMEWKIKLGCTEKAIRNFLSTGAPMPEGLTQIARYHAPGSVKGWLVVETDNPEVLYIHASEWAELLEWNTTPIVADDIAGKGAAIAWSKSVSLE